MIVKLPYGASHLPVDLRGLRVRPVAPRAPRSRLGAGDLVAAAIDRPVEGPPLSEIAAGARTATLIVPDTTRKVDLPAIVPVVLERLRSAGVSASRTTILLACGTHPAIGDPSLGEFVGDVPADVSVIEHDSRNDGELAFVGELRPGLPLRLHRAAVEADVLVTLGTVRHHYFAGFGGGPKMVFPGVAGHDEIQANHSLVVAADEDGKLTRHPACEPGVLTGNPVAEEIGRAAEARPPDMAVCLVEDGAGGTAWAGAGPWRAAFSAAVARTREWFEAGSGAAFDLMVASGGGKPSDSTLIQAHKAFDAASRFLRPGGHLLFVAAMDRGAGSDAMRPFLEDPRPEVILDALHERWIQYGHTTLRLIEKTCRFRVSLCSDFDPEIGRRLGFEPIADPEAVADGWRERHPGATVGVMSAGVVFPRS